MEIQAAETWTKSNATINEDRAEAQAEVQKAVKMAEECKRQADDAIENQKQIQEFAETRFAEVAKEVEYHVRTANKEVEGHESSLRRAEQRHAAQVGALTAEARDIIGKQALASAEIQEDFVKKASEQADRLALMGANLSETESEKQAFLANMMKQKPESETQTLVRLENRMQVQMQEQLNQVMGLFFKHRQSAAKEQEDRWQQSMREAVATAVATLVPIRTGTVDSGNAPTAGSGIHPAGTLKVPQYWQLLVSTLAQPKPQLLLQHRSKVL